MPDSVISSCQIDKHGTGLLFCRKGILDVLHNQKDLTYGRLFVSKSSLFLWEQGVDYWFDAVVDQSFEDLVRDAEQRDGTVAMLVLYRFWGLGHRDYQRSSPDFWNFELAQAGRKEAT